MNRFLRKGILLVCMVLCLSTTLLIWEDHPGIQTLDGVSLLSGNACLTVLILGMYFVGVVFYEKARGVFFCMGLSSLSMLFALMASRFEHVGRFASKCPGPYAGLAAVIATAALYIFLTIRAPKAAQDKHNA